MNLHPPCQGCGRPRRSHTEPSFPGAVVHGSGDLCGTCVSRAQRRERGMQPAVGPYPPAPDWTDAACAEVGEWAGDIWFPEVGEHNDRAKAVCAGCPIREACLTYALDTRQPYGVWAGLSTAERNALLRRRAAA